MRQYFGASSIFYLFVGLSFLLIFLLAPYPYFQNEGSYWFLGASVGSRLIGREDVGVPLDQVAVKISYASISNPFNTECENTSDCKKYEVTNQCKIYCGSTVSDNITVMSQLNNNRVCDPALWGKPKTTCTCLSGKCVSL